MLAFSGYADAINETPDLDLPDPKSVPADVPFDGEASSPAATRASVGSVTVL